MDSPQHQTPFKKSDFTFDHDFNQIIDLLLHGHNQDAVGKAVAHLQDKFTHAKQVLQSLPGLQYSQQEQERILAQEVHVLERKKQQLAAFKHLLPSAK
ncbi:hypothetical protein INT47_003160 [Mucor saturninus]|uniref:Mediator of RNA polymerase II transcription subunit 9 n=1 Tax=Mucor saturninus TaxID=64648 RepID=A0A8H7QZU2_9FUNG|nr:hypothetical protein INT47_003160 [Mucor saturninus]